jgi:hypothetical protein
MSGGFSNPLVGGDGSLVYPQIKSPDFNLALLLGWAILKNGNAYLNNVQLSGIVDAMAAVLNPGPLLLYGNTSQVVTYLTGTGTWTAPAGVTAPDGTPNAVQAECWGPGGPAGSAAERTGGGGGEYAMEPHLAVTPLSGYAYSQGTGGTGGTSGNPLGTPGPATTFAGDAVTVTANPGFCAPGVPNGGSGSTNTVHFNGGSAGNLTTGSVGSGGGGSAGTGSAGNNGHNTGGGGAGAAAVPGGGAGGSGGTGTGHAGFAPGGGAGGTGTSGINGANGAAGQIRVTYTISGTTSLIAAIAAAAGTDPATGLGFPGPGLGLADAPVPASLAGWAALYAAAGHLKYVSGGDANAYGTGRLTLLTSGQTISSTTDTVITGLQAPVAAGTYRIRALIAVTANQTAGTATIDLHGPAVSAGGSGFRFTNSTGPGAGNNWTDTGLAGGGFAMTSGQLTWVEFEGTVTFSAAGTISVQAHTSAGADTFATHAGSWLELLPVA